MLKNFKHKIKKNSEILGLVFLIFLTVALTSYFNFKKKVATDFYDGFFENIYFKKTLSYIIDNLEPKYKNIKHKIRPGETFDKILKEYFVEKNEILKIKNSLKKKLILIN